MEEIFYRTRLRSYSAAFQILYAVLIHLSNYQHYIEKFSVKLPLLVNTENNVYGAVIITKSLRDAVGSSDEYRTVPSGWLLTLRPKPTDSGQESANPPVGC